MTQPKISEQFIIFATEIENAAITLTEELKASGISEEEHRDMAAKIFFNAGELVGKVSNVLRSKMMEEKVDAE